MFSVRHYACSYQQRRLAADTIRKLIVVGHWESKMKEEQDRHDRKDKQSLGEDSNVMLIFGNADHQIAEDQVISYTEMGVSEEREEEDID